MPITLATVAIHDESTMQALVEWAKALKGGIAGVAQKACSELAVAAIKKAIGGVHSYQIKNQTDGMLRWKKGNEWKEFSRKGRCKTLVVYQFSGRGGTITKVSYPALVRAIQGKIEVAVTNPRTGMTLETVRTGLDAKQLSATEWTVRGWPTYPK